MVILDAASYPDFSSDLIAWQQQHGRHSLPWQNTDDAYRIWLSEIMLQQTQVAAVIPYYRRFLVEFPTITALAAAPIEQVMAQWSGLGYYSRARNLHRCAGQIVQQYHGKFPRDPELLIQLPGIGRSTAAAIAAFAYGVRAAILDGNVKRVLARVFGIDAYVDTKPVQDQLWRYAEALLPDIQIESYTQGLMDLGATVCTRSKPDCRSCPLHARCVAYASGRVDQLPRRQPKKIRPEKNVAMFVIVDQAQVLLMQRPASGIWGGLLSLPELELNIDSSVEPVNQLALSALLNPIGGLNTCLPLPAFTHGFTHFKLHVMPYQVGLKSRATLVGQLPYVWCDITRLATAALPAPVKKLLLAVAAESAAAK